MGQLEGKVALITGASKGIGRVMSRLFAKEGAAVVCAARSRDLVEETAAPRVEPSPPQTSSGRVATLDEVERDHIVRVWALAKGHKGRTCQMLGISRPTLERKLKKYGIAAGAG